MANKKILVFDRTPVARLISCAAVFASAAIFFMYLADHPKDFELMPMAGLVILFLLTLATAIIQYGDHIYFSEQGVMYENRLLSLFGKRGKWMRWEDIIEIREMKENVLVLMSRDGRRILVDAILGYAYARAEILRRAPQALVTGTLARDSS